MVNDYSIIGSISGFNQRYLPLERIPSYDNESSVRIKEITELKHKDETDIEFMESLYRNSNPDYYLGGWIVKSVVDILLQFTIGDLPTIQANDNNYAKFCNNLWSNNQSRIYNLIRELGLFGQEFAYIGYDNDTGYPRIRPMSRKNIIDIRYEDFDNPEEITYIRFREQLQEVTRIGEDEYGDDRNEYHDVYYDKIFWKELKSTKKDGTQVWIYKMKILKRIDNEKWFEFMKEKDNPYGVIPVIEFNQNKLSFDKVGYSDLTGAMKIISIYHQVLEACVNNNLYNSQPTLVFSGIKTDPIKFVKAMYGDKTLESGDVLEEQGLYNVFGSYYLGAGENVHWLTTPSTTQFSKQILELLFYILVQVSGVPEWCLGAGMNGAWATVKQQSVPLLQKIRSKRMDMTDSLLKLNKVCYIVYKNRNKTKDEKPVTDFTSKIIWGDILTDDIDLTLRLVEFMLEHNFITKETAVSIIGMIDDPLGELKKAQKQVEKEQKQQNDDNKSTIENLMKSKAIQQSDEDETDSEEDVQDGEMVSKVAMRVIRMLMNMPDVQAG